MKKKMLSALLCVVTAVSMLAGCGGTGAENSEKKASGQEETLEFWTIDLKATFGDFFNEMIQQYEKENPGVKINWTDIPYDDVQSKLVTAVAGGTAPDVVNLNTQMTLTLAGEGALVDLNKEATEEQKSIYIQDLWNSAKIGDSVYAFPWYASPDIMFYNKELFEEAGIQAPDVAYATWDEFFEACDKLKASGITPLGMDTADSGWLTNLWMSALIGTNGESGNEWMNTMYPTDFNIPEVEEAAEMVQKMFQEYTTADAIGGKYDPMATHFFNGEVAMFPNGPWMIPDFLETEKAPEGFYDKVGIMLMPGNGMEMVPTPGDMVGATEKEKIEAAVAFLKFETKPENQIKALEMTGLQPVSNNLEIPEELTKSNPLMAQVLELQNRSNLWTKSGILVSKYNRYFFYGITRTCIW